jgi:hypothetical protein
MLDAEKLSQALLSAYTLSLYVLLGESRQAFRTCKIIQINTTGIKLFLNKKIMSKNS